MSSAFSNSLCQICLKSLFHSSLIFSTSIFTNGDVNGSGGRSPLAAATRISATSHIASHKGFNSPRVFKTFAIYSS